MRTRYIVGLLLAGAVTVGTYHSCGGEAELASASHLTHQLWIDRMPNDERDMIRKLALVRSVDHGKFGVAELGSVWRHRTEVFKWGLHDGRLQMHFPQDRRHMTVRVRTWECEGEAPDGFELCLEVRGEGGQSLRMYSRHEWKLRPRPGEDIVEDGPLSAWELPALVEPQDEDPPQQQPSSLDALFAQ